VKLVSGAVDEQGEITSENNDNKSNNKKKRR
jgi:hypothetical protein